jgi:hypothetical protein
MVGVFRSFKEPRGIPYTAVIIGKSQPEILQRDGDGQPIPTI